MRKTNLFTFLLTVLAVIWTLSCERPTANFERSNTLDPRNEGYKSGSASELEFSFNSEGIITISWQDTARFEDGFIIEKSLNDSSSFTEIGIVGADVTFFRDSSKHVRKNTFYKVSAFMERGDEITMAEPAIRKMEDLGAITNFDLEYNSNTNSLDLFWESNSPFDKKFKLAYKKDIDEEFRIISEFDSEADNYTDDLSDISFNDREYKLLLLLAGEDYEDEISVSTGVFEKSLFGPSDLQIEVQNEQTINLTWNDNSFFEEGFKIFLAGQEVENLSSNSNHYQHEIDLKTDTDYTYSIQAYTSKSESSLEDQSRYYSISTPFIIYDRYNNIDGGSINISWDIEDDIFVNQYILERKRGPGDTWDELQRFDKQTKDYTDNGTDPDSGYIYRVRTISSDNSEVLELYYRDLFDKIAAFDAHPKMANTVAFSPDGNYVASLSNQIKVWDISQEKLHLTINDKTASYSDVTFNREGTIIAGTIRDYEGEVTLHEFPSGTLIKRIRTIGTDRVKISSDSQFLYVSTRSANIKKYNIDSEEKLFEYQGRTSPYVWKSNISLSPDDDLITINDKTPTVISTANGSIIKDLTEHPDYYHPYSNDPEFSHDGSRVAILYNKVLQIFDTDSWQKIYSSGNWGRYYPQFDPFDSNIIIGAEQREKVQFRDISENKIVNKITATDDYILSIDYSNDGSRVAIGFRDGSVEVWQISNQKGWKTIY